MREILFRGKRVDNGEWIEGYFLPGNERQSLHPCIFVYLPETQSFECFDIDIDTLGEYTGLTDTNGSTKIFEYDIIDANGRKVGNYYENSNLLKDGTCFLVAKMGTKEWSRSEQEAIKRGCKYAE